jgi:hypothetical protein
VTSESLLQDLLKTERIDDEGKVKVMSMESKPVILGRKRPNQLILSAQLKIILNTGHAYKASFDESLPQFIHRWL